MLLGAPSLLTSYLFFLHFFGLIIFHPLMCVFCVLGGLAWAMASPHDGRHWALSEYYKILKLLLTVQKFRHKRKLGLLFCEWEAAHHYLEFFFFPERIKIWNFFSMTLMFYNNKFNDTIIKKIYWDYLRLLKTTTTKCISKIIVILYIQFEIYYILVQ